VDGADAPALVRFEAPEGSIRITADGDEVSGTYTYEKSSTNQNLATVNADFGPVGRAVLSLCFDAGARFSLVTVKDGKSETATGVFVEASGFTFVP
jgi:hypothetical protein